MVLRVQVNPGSGALVGTGIHNTGVRSRRAKDFPDSSLYIVPNEADTSVLMDSCEVTQMYSLLALTMGKYRKMRTSGNQRVKHWDASQPVCTYRKGTQSAEESVIYLDVHAL
ncbi:hypothetical protein Bbelb_211170 [Branchiostoma belcheri]|nr:hypothetical protein Bbelb_211170 [Branchiostoma belcheri]